MIKGQINRMITILNVYTSNNGASKYMKQRQRDLPGGPVVKTLGFQCRG